MTDALFRKPASLVLISAALGGWANPPAGRAAGMKDFYGPQGTERFGGDVKVLPNGNFVVVDEHYMAPGSGVRTGAVFVYKPDGTLISTLTGSHNDDRIGSGGITVLANGNFVIESYRWDNGAVIDAGAVTWGSMTDGINGVVSPENSLVGSSHNDQIGDSAETRGTGGILALSNGNYVVMSPTWDNGFTLQNAGAVTWGNGTTGVKGPVSAANSLVGSSANDSIGRIQNGGGVTEVGVCHYVVASPSWRNGTVGGAGAVTWCEGTLGRTGPITPENSLVGGAAGDNVGGSPGQKSSVLRLSDGNYVVASPLWNRGGIADAGAVTWCPGGGGRTGLITELNSLVGAKASDKIAGYETSFPGAPPVIALKNGNYAVASFRWDKGAIPDAGAVTWCAAEGLTTGEVTEANSVTGSTAGDMIGRMVVLSSGDYAVAGEMWDNGSVPNAGAVRLMSGSGPSSGVLSPGNSLVGTQADDRVSSAGLTALTNGNLVVASPRWKNGTAANAGAVTWVSGATGLTGPVTADNSLTGSQSGDLVGGYLNVGDAPFGGRVTALTNGHYVVASPLWKKGGDRVGAVTWGNGQTGLRGPVTSENSITAAPGTGRVGGGIDEAHPGGVTALANGHYVIGSPAKKYDTQRGGGAFTWASGSGPTSAVISEANSLMGSTNDQNLGAVAPSVLPDGGYVLVNPETFNGAALSSGVLFYADGSGPVSGFLTVENSVVGAAANGGAYLTFAADPAGNRILAGAPYDNRITIITKAETNFPELTLEKADGSPLTAGGVLEAGETAAATTRVVNLIFRNPGYADLTLTSVTSSDPRFTVRVPAGAITLARGQSLLVPVIFRSENAGAASAVIHLLSNDPANPDLSFTVNAKALDVIDTITTDIAGPPGSGRFGREVFYLPNGNLVITDPWYDAPGQIKDAGAVYLYSPFGAMISQLTGSTAGDYVGDGGITVLTNGNFVIRSATWHNPEKRKTGAVTWASGVTGVSGPVSAANSLVGDMEADDVGGGYTFQGRPGVFALPGGNYVVLSPVWNKYTGAATWGSGKTGISGVISAANSLTGGLVGDGGLTILKNGHCVVTSTGAVTWISATAGASGQISAANSLFVPDYEGDPVTVQALSDGNYAAVWSGFNGGAGAVAWGNGSTGAKGGLNPANALIGGTGDKLGSGGVTALPGGQYAVLSPQWSEQRGAVTWAAAGGGTTGSVTAANSLTGSQPLDRVGGSPLTLLANGNAVVTSPDWANGAAAKAGAVTWIRSQSPVTGPVSPGNSLTGTRAGDAVGANGVTALDDGNYVAGSGAWNQGQGAVTWGDGFTGRTGPVTALNSLTGPTGPSIQPGYWLDKITALRSGAWVLSFYAWKNAAGDEVGAVTRMSGTTDGSGVWTGANALTGTTKNDGVGSWILPLTNGHFIIISPGWSDSRGAITWADGFKPLTGGPLSSANSLTGTTPGDALGRDYFYNGYTSHAALPNGNYLIGSPFWSGPGGLTETGAITPGDGAKGTTGELSASNSLLGRTRADHLGSGGFRIQADSAWALNAVTFKTASFGDSGRYGAMVLGEGLVRPGGLGTLSRRGGVWNEGERTDVAQGLAYNPALRHWAVGRPNDCIVTTFSYEPLGQPRLSPELPGGLALSAGSTVDFGWVAMGEFSERTVTVVNTGGESLNFGEIAAGNPAGSSGFSLRIPLGSTLLPPGQRADLIVRFTPDAPGVRMGTLRLPSNDPASPAFTLNLRGVVPPSAAQPFGGETIAPEITAPVGGKTAVRFHAVPGITYRLERSPDLKDWSFGSLVTADETGTVHFLDPDAPPGSAFYRLRSR